MTTDFRVVGWFVIIGWAATACAPAALPAAPAVAPAAPEAEAPASGAQAPTEDSSDLDALERDLSSSEQRLLAQVARVPKEGAAESSLDQFEENKAVSGAPSGKPQPSAAPAGAADSARTAPPDRERPAEHPSPCDRGCRALESMRHSAAGICELVGRTNDRCLGAEKRVKVATERLHGAGCRCAVPKP